MCKVIEFAKYKQEKEIMPTCAERLKAMVEGQIEYYICDSCGADIEVINKLFPQRCPVCNTEIEEWND